MVARLSSYGTAIAKASLVKAAMVFATGIEFQDATTTATLTFNEQVAGNP
jgi:hypothetical protein